MFVIDTANFKHLKNETLKNSFGGIFLHGLDWLRFLQCWSNEVWMKDAMLVWFGEGGAGTVGNVESLGKYNIRGRKREEAGLGGGSHQTPMLS